MLGPALRTSLCFLISSCIVSIRSQPEDQMPCAPSHIRITTLLMSYSCRAIHIAVLRLNFSQLTQRHIALQYNCGICDVCGRIILYNHINNQLSHTSVARLSSAVYMSLGVAFMCYLCTYDSVLNISLGVAFVYLRTNDRIYVVN